MAAEVGNGGQQPSIPDYSLMILEAIDALKEETGSNESTIAKHIESTRSDLPPAHTTLLSHHLDKMKQSGQIVMLKNNYMRPDPNAPPKRGRGRPPKPKAPLPTGTVVSPPRPRGRPPKDPSAPPKPKTTPGSGRPRGRPPKRAKTTEAAVPPAPGVKRGRGRPPKV
ncbi:hypothetical protein GQ457_10G027160 [Hibiscus cannabinus]